MIGENPGLFKFWGNFRGLLNISSSTSSHRHFRGQLFVVYIAYIAISIPSHLFNSSTPLDNNRQLLEMSFLGIGSKTKTPYIPPSPFPIPKGITHGAAQLLSTPKTSWENDYDKFGTYENDTRMFDSKLFIAHSKVRRFLYLFDRDLRGTDFTSAFINIDINKQTQHTYLSPAHDLFFHKDEYLPRVAFYLAPPIDKAGPPPTLKTSKHYVEFLRTKFSSPSTPIRGWFITTGFDREISSKAFLPTMNGSFIQIKDYISEIYVFKETKNQFALVRNNAPNFYGNEWSIPSYRCPMAR